MVMGNSACRINLHCRRKQKRFLSSESFLVIMGRSTSSALRSLISSTVWWLFYLSALFLASNSKELRLDLLSIAFSLASDIKIIYRNIRENTPEIEQQISGVIYSDIVLVIDVLHILL